MDLEQQLVAFHFHTPHLIVCFRFRRINPMPANPQILQQNQQLQLQVQQVLEEQRQASLYSIRILNHPKLHIMHRSVTLSEQTALPHPPRPTKDHAIDINSANALAALNLLGVPNLPQGAEQRRLIFLLHIGILH